MIDTIGNAELKNKEEELLKNMKMLRHTVADMLGSTSFLKGLAPGAQNGVITVNGEQFPIYITANTLAADGLPEITDDIYDEDNYLSLVSDDDLMWYALVEHLGHQTELLQNENNQYNDDLVKANEEIDNLQCKLAEEIKARQGYEASLNQFREENNQLKEFLNAADNEIEGLEESLREANKTCTEHVKENVQLEIDNKRLSERVRTLVCEKCNGKDLPLKFGEQERLGAKQADKIIEDYEASKEGVKMDMEMAILHQNNLELNSKVALLTSALDTAQKENESLNEELGNLKSNNAYLKKEKEEAELLAYRLTRGDMHVQFDSMKSLEHDNSILKKENADLNQKLCQKVMHATYSAHGGEPEEETEKPTSEITKETEDDLRKRIAEYAQRNDELLDCNKRLRQEISKFRVQMNSYSGATVVDKEDMQQTITQGAMAELTARIKELESINENLQEELKKKNEVNDTNAEALEFYQKNCREFALKNKDLETKIEDLQKETEDFERVAAAHLETTQKFADYKEKHKRLYKHFRNLAEMIEDLMELE